jgi:hypothetical protein
MGPQGPVGPAGNGSISVTYVPGIVTPVVRAVTSTGEQVTVNALKVTPSTVTASSFVEPWQPSNVLVNDGVWWHSAVNSSNAEWVNFDFQTPVVVSSVYARCGLGRNGLNNKIQGSSNNVDWVDIHTFSSSNWTYGTNQTYTSFISASNAFRYVRLFSDPSPYCLYDFIQYTGVQ